MENTLCSSEDDDDENRFVNFVSIDTTSILLFDSIKNGTDFLALSERVILMSEPILNQEVRNISCEESQKLKEEEKAETIEESKVQDLGLTQLIQKVDLVEDQTQASELPPSETFYYEPYPEELIGEKGDPIASSYASANAARDRHKQSDLMNLDKLITELGKKIQI